MKKVILELVVTVIIGLWVCYILMIDLPNTVNPGWHTTTYSKSYMQLKLVLFIFTIIFFLYRVIKLSSLIRREKDSR